MKKTILIGVLFFVTPFVSSAAVSLSQIVNLETGWNVVSTPRVVESHLFSAPETLENFNIYALDASQPSGWATFTDLGQTEFTPLFGYFIYNNTAAPQTLTFNYKASTTPNERLFDRSFSVPGWYSIGVSNPTYADRQGEPIVDEDNLSQVLNSIASSSDMIVDFTAATAFSAPSSVALHDPWGASLMSDVNILPDIRDTKAYAVHMSDTQSHYVGFQNESDDGGIAPSPILETLDIVKNPSYANQSVAVPQTAYKIGSFNATSAGPESVNIDTITLNFSSTSASLENITDVYVKYGTNTTSIKNSLVAGDNTFSISEVLASGNTLPIEVYATLSSSVGSSDTVIVRLSVSGTTSNTAQAVTTNFVTGQTITAVIGSISVAFVNDPTLATKLQVGNTSPKVASFRFTALNDTFTVTDIAVKVGGIAAAGAIRDITLKSPGMTDKIVSLNGLVATSTGMSIIVPSNDTTGKIVDVYLNLNDVGNNAATSGANVTVTLEGFISNASTGTRAESSTDVTSNAQYVFKSVPTINRVSLPSTVLSPGIKTISKFNISADAAGQISWKKLVWTIAKTAGVTIGPISTLQLVDSSGNIIAGTFATTTGAIVSGDIYAPNSMGGTLSFVADSEQSIATSETYSLKGIIGGTMTSGNSITTSIENSTTFIATPNSYDVIAGSAGAQTPSFIWSDRSALGHSTATADWVNDYKVRNLPTESQTLSI